MTTDVCPVQLSEGAEPRWWEFGYLTQERAQSVERTKQWFAVKSFLQVFSASQPCRETTFGQYAISPPVVKITMGFGSWERLRKHGPRVDEHDFFCHFCDVDSGGKSFTNKRVNILSRICKKVLEISAPRMALTCPILPACQSEFNPYFSWKML